MGRSDSIVIRSYKPNDNFLHLVDTILVVSTGPALYNNSGDPIVDVGGADGNGGDPRHLIVPGYDCRYIFRL